MFDYTYIAGLANFVFDYKTASSFADDELGKNSFLYVEMNTKYVFYVFHTVRIRIINTSVNKCTSYSIQNINSYGFFPGTAITWF